MWDEYSSKVIRNFKNPKNMGELKNPDGVARVGNPQCLVPGTMVHANPDVKSIEALSIGKRVLSHDGEFHNIKRTMKREYNGTVVTIKSRLGTVTLTPDHEVLSMTVPEGDKFLRTNNKLTLVPDWNHASDLKRGDILLYPIPKGELDMKEIPIRAAKKKYEFKIAKMVEIDESKRSTVRTWADNSFVYVPITSVSKSPYSGLVYNLEVEGAGSYVTDAATVHNCGDIMEMQIKVKDNKIKDIKFRTFGCVAAIATSSMATQMVKGKTLDDALRLTDRAVAEALSGLPPVKMHCSNLAATAIKKAINDYKKKHGLPYEEVEEEHEHGHDEGEERPKAKKDEKRKTGPKGKRKGKKGGKRPDVRT